MASKVILPRLGMNMESATIVRWHRREGDVVAVGDILADIETDKVTMELEAESAGILRRLLAEDGDSVEVFRPVAVIGTADEDIEGLLAELAAPDDATPSHVDRVYDVWRGGSQPSNQTVPLDPPPSPPRPASAPESRGSRADAQSIREQLIRRGVLGSRGDAQPVTGRERIVIYGAGLGARQLMEVIRHLDNVEVLGLIDDKAELCGAEIAGKRVLGGFAELARMVERSTVDGVALSFHSEVRRKVHRRIARELGLRVVPLVDPRAIVGMDVQIGDGALIEAGATVGPGVIVGEGTIIDVGATVAHDCNLGAFSHLSPGCALSGVVNLTENVLVGVGAAINSTVTIGKNVIIAAGAAVMNDVPDDVVVSGVPAKILGQSRRGA